MAQPLSSEQFDYRETYLRWCTDYEMDPTDPYAMVEFVEGHPAEPEIVDAIR